MIGVRCILLQELKEATIKVQPSYLLELQWRAVMAEKLLRPGEGGRQCYPAAEALLLRGALDGVRS